MTGEETMSFLEIVAKIPMEMVLNHDNAEARWRSQTIARPPTDVKTPTMTFM
ncbi:hypothetical protein TIFTF001_024068 [Ficus carica]|uniref:Uncharacterized protein n=1 Tax=Ficus carica TaxID=3494 RepID=A0AA88B0H5_FICCA|nr:hypothetical protein TIFTF001_024068 [Ficus carica]